MRLTKLSTFEKHVQDASIEKYFTPVYLIVSKDAFVRKRAIELLTSALTRDLLGKELNLIHLEGENCSKEQLYEELNTFGLFSKEKILVLRDLDKLCKEDQKILEHGLLLPPSTTRLLLTATALSSTITLYKKIEKIGVILDVEEEKEWVKEKTKTEWLIAEFAKYQKKITPFTAQLFVKSVGTDLFALDQEVKKVLCFMGDRVEITPSDLEILCEYSGNSYPWLLGESILKKDFPQARRLSKKTLETGTSFLALIRQVRHQLNVAFQMSTMLHAGMNLNDISHQFPYMTPHILEKQINIAQQYGINQFKQGIIAIDKLEFLAKNGIDNDDLLNDLLLFNLTESYT